MIKSYNSEGKIKYININIVECKLFELESEKIGEQYKYKHSGM